MDWNKKRKNKQEQQISQEQLLITQSQICTIQKVTLMNIFKYQTMRPFKQKKKNPETRSLINKQKNSFCYDKDYFKQKLDKKKYEI